MKKAAAIIVKFRKLITLIFIALMVFSAFSYSWVYVENDITAYLADSAEAKRGLTIMGSEFATYATADVMVENISLKEAEKLADTLSEVDGVLMLNFDTTEGHYKDNCALYNIRFSGTADTEIALNAMAEVKGILSDYEHCINSESFSNLSDIINTEMGGVLVIVIIVVVGVLIFTSTTYAEVIVLLGTFIAAAVINMGTNYFMGTISFVSNAVAVVLQLALSVDYAIIFCNRYKEEHETKNIEDSVISALALSIPEISASSLTTIAGLAAMTFMQFRLGLDMGIALIKAIICSLFTVFLFMPALLMGCGKLMDKTRHKSFVPKVSFAGKFAYATRFIIPPIFALVVVMAFMGYGQVRYAYSMDLVKCIHRNEEDIAKERISERFGENNMIAMLVPSGDYQKEAALIRDIEMCQEVNSVLGLAGIDAIDGYSLPDRINYRQFMELADVDEQTAQALFAYYAAGDDYREAANDLSSFRAPVIDLFLAIKEVADSGRFELDKAQQEMVDDLYSQLVMAQEQLQGENYSRIIIYVDLPNQGEETFEFIDKLHIIGGRYYGDDVVLTGNAVSAKDFNGYFESDTKIVTVLSVSLVMLILLMTFRSFGMPLLLILVIQGSIWLNFTISVFAGTYVFFMCNLIVTAIQMGANIDYAIVISSRYSEMRKNDIGQREAIIETLNLAFPTVITSGTMMVIAGLLIGSRVSQVVIAGMGLYVGTGTMITLVLVNFVLPQILIFGDGFVKATTLKFKGIMNLKTRRVIIGEVLATAIIFAAMVLPAVYGRVETVQRENIAEYEALLERTAELKALSDKLDAEEAEYNSTAYDFAEHLVTDTIGSDRLREGQEAYDEGANLLKDAKDRLEKGEYAYWAGYYQLEAGKAAYAAGEQKLAEAQAQYDEGQNQLNTAKAELEAGKAALEAGKAELAAGEAKLARVRPMYNTVMPIYYRYLECLDLAADAEARGDYLAASAHRTQAYLYQGLVTTELGGYSIESIVTEYEEGMAQIEIGRQEIADGEAQIAEGEAEIADAEAQLADAKNQLDEGYAQLEAAKRDIEAGEIQLEAAKYQLDQGKRAIAEGENELADSENALDEGRKTLEENRKKLTENLAALDNYSDEREKLKAGMSLLLAEEGVSSLLSPGAGYSDICAAAEMHFTAKLNTVITHGRLAAFAEVGLLAAIVFALAALALWLLKRVPLSVGSAVLATLFAGGSGIAWTFTDGQYGVHFFLAAAMLAFCSALFAVIIPQK